MTSITVSESDGVKEVILNRSKSKMIVAVFSFVLPTFFIVLSLFVTLGGPGSISPTHYLLVVTSIFWLLTFFMVYPVKMIMRKEDGILRVIKKDIFFIWRTYVISPDMHPTFVFRKRRMIGEVTYVGKLPHILEIRYLDAGKTKKINSVFIADYLIRDLIIFGKVTREDFEKLIAFLDVPEGE